jgi:hypothetical protein
LLGSKYGDVAISTEQLAAQLGLASVDLSALDGVAEPDVEALLALVEGAFRADAVDTDTAVERALRAIPWPIRGQARRILAGGHGG